MVMLMKLSKILLALLTGFFGVLTFSCIHNKEYIVGGVNLALFLVSAFGLTKAIKYTDNPTKEFKKNVNKVLKTYDSILVEIEALPKLSEKKLIKALSFKDMVNAEYELRKPIYFYLQEHAIDYILINKKSAYIYTSRETDEQLSELDIYLLQKRKIEEEKEEEFNLIDSLDKTTVIKLDNLKEYKVSPIKKKKNEETEESRDYKFFVGYEKFLEDLDKV